jgi:hypothetical protein
MSQHAHHPLDKRWNREYSGMTLTTPLTPQGGAITMFLVTAACMGFVIVSMAEMASM